MSAVEVLLRFAVAALAGYVLGSIPSGVVVGKIFGNVDPRSQGSGKTGATNVLRTLGLGPAVMVGVIDVLKGVVAVLLARFVFFPFHADATQQNLQATAEAIAGFGALLGHNFSMFIHFSGGRGVATGGGAILAMSPVAVLCGLVAMVISIAITRYVSLGSMLAATVSALTLWVLTLTGHALVPQAIFATVGGLFIVVSHHDNIRRLLNGTERKLGDPAQPAH
jgi:glycerol-3-phosphate acyltransferase PlsY